MVEFNNKNVLVLGLQKSGKAAIRLLKTINTTIYITDEKIMEEIDGTTYIPYQDLLDFIDNIDIIVKSPGIPYDIPILVKAREKQVLIIGEIELAYHFIDKNKVIVAVTGTNGKTTTTSLITEILKASNIEAVSVGNIGYALSDAVLDEANCDVYVIELSSFQLLDTHFFKPHIGIILNLTEAHLDYHHTFNNYVNAKMNLLKQLTSDSIVIYNADNKLIRKKMKGIRCHKYAFSLYDNIYDTYVENKAIKYNGTTIIRQEEIKLPGEHNLYNVLAAITCAKVFYIENKIIKNTVANFESLPHRIQFVRKVNGVTYYNDSKSTNPESTICALNAFTEPVILLLGGYERNQDFTEIIKHQNSKIIITFGQTKERIQVLARSLNKTCFVCDDLEGALNYVQNITQYGDIVLLSPASASWDQFCDYEKRGQMFIDYVNRLH